MYVLTYEEEIAEKNTEIYPRDYGDILIYGSSILTFAIFSPL